ncbi:MAG: nitrate/nitrite transporter NrtS [Pseudomonadota bacterium]
MRAGPCTFLGIARHPSVVRRALRIACVVGLVLALLNHGDTIFAGQAQPATWAKVVLTFLVPYSVSTYSSVMAVRERLQAIHPMEAA